MNLTIVYDNEAAADFEAAWGFSCLITHGPSVVLFDTGWDGAMLMRNLSRLPDSAGEPNHIVISHDHWDHTGGLWALLKKASNIRVYACRNFKHAFRKKVLKNGGDIVEVEGFAKITPSIFTSGEIYTRYKGKSLVEQALIIKTRKGISLLTGCAHPGIVNLINRIKLEYPSKSLYLAMGGFHLKDKSKQVIKGTIKRLKELGLKKVVAAHCSGSGARSEFKKKYGDHCIKVLVGQEINV